MKMDDFSWNLGRDYLKLTIDSDTAAVMKKIKCRYCDYTTTLNVTLADLGQCTSIWVTAPDSQTTGKNMQSGKSLLCVMTATLLSVSGK